MASASPTEKAEPIQFDEILARLRVLVERLEGGSLTLEEGLSYFEEGMSLCRRGAQVLDQAEKRVEILLSTAGGTPQTEPLDRDDRNDRNENDTPNGRDNE